MKKAILHMVLIADDSTATSSLLGYLENSYYHNNEEANLDGTDFDTKFAMGEVTMWTDILTTVLINGVH